MACDEMQKHHFNDRINTIICRPIHVNNVKCDMNVSVKIKKPKHLHDWSHGVALTVCKYKIRPSILKHQSNIATKPATGMQRYTLTKNKHLTSLKAI